MIVSVLMVISSLYFVEHLYQLRTLPLIVPFVLSMISPVACFPKVLDKPLSLLSPNLLDLTDLFLYLTSELFTNAFSFQLRIIDEYTCDLLDLPLYFVIRSFRLVSNA